MNALTRQVLSIALTARAAKPQCFYDLARSELMDPTVVANPCDACQGRGECECGSGPFDPDADVYVDTCPECDGSGDAVCPSCENPAPLLVRGDGRCHGCILQAALELAEAEE